MPSSPPRIRFSLKTDKHKFAIFANAVDYLIDRDSKNLELEVLDDESFIKHYKLLTSIIEHAVTCTFGCAKPYWDQMKSISSSRICELVSSICSVASAISISKGSNQTFSFASCRTFDKYQYKFHSEEPQAATILTEYLVAVRRSLHCKLYAEKKKVVNDQIEQYDHGRILTMLMDRSLKKLLEGSSAFVPLLTALNFQIHKGVIETDPAMVVKLTRQYFEDLYKWSPPSDKPKPWLITPSILKVCKKVTEDLFIWPVGAILADFQAMLHKGNPRPSLGPDG